MPRLRDLSAAFQSVGVFAFSRRVWNEVSDDNLFTWASALAYSWLFAVFPFLVFLITLLPYLPEEAKVDARQGIMRAITQLPEHAAITVKDVVEPQLKNILDAPPRGFRTMNIIGIFVTLWAAAGGMSMTMSALDRAYDVEKPRKFIRHRSTAVGLTVVVACLILAVIILMPIGTLATRWLSDQIARNKAWLPDILLKTWVLYLWNISRYVLALLLMFMAVGVLYRFGPNVRQRWRLITPGSVFTIMVWLVLGIVFRLYVDKFGRYNQTYGAVGGVAILLLFFYIDALVLLIGAEINSEVDFEVHKIPRGTRDFRASGALAANASAGPNVT